MAGRKPLAPAEQHGPDFVGATPADMAAQEAGARNALAVIEVKVAAMAEELGYQGALTVGTVYNVDFDDWMFLMDDKVMLNRSLMSKFGFRLGEVTLSFVKRTPQ